MATAVTSQRIQSRMAITSYDHDPGATTAVVVSPDGGTTQRWVPMRDFDEFYVQVRPTIAAANGITLLEIVGAVDVAGTSVTVILAHAASITDTLDKYLGLEVNVDQINEVGNAASLKFTHVAARITMATNTDEANATYIRTAKRQFRNLTVDTST